MIYVFPKIGELRFDRDFLDTLGINNRVDVAFIPDDGFILVSALLPFKKKYTLRLRGKKKNVFVDLNLTDFLLKEFELEIEFCIRLKNYEFFELGNQLVAAVQLRKDN